MHCTREALPGVSAFDARACLRALRRVMLFLVHRSVRVFPFFVGGDTQTTK